MRVKVVKQKAVQYMRLDDNCQKCALYSKSLVFCVQYVNCSLDGLFYQTETSEDIFKL